MRRWNSKIKQLKAHHHHRNWDEKYWAIMFKWAGHVARIQTYDKDRITHRVLQHKSWDGITKIQESNSGSQLHGRKLKVWRWEAPLYKLFGRQSWQELAQDKTAWDSHLEEMISWRQ